MNRPMIAQPPNSVIIGSYTDVLELAFGPTQKDSHAKAWAQHQFRLSETGRAMMRNRLAARYPGVPVLDALALYSATTESHMQQDYV